MKHLPLDGEAWVGMRHVIPEHVSVSTKYPVSAIWKGVNRRMKVVFTRDVMYSENKFIALLPFSMLKPTQCMA